MKGRPILGVISGFLFGLFAGLSLFMWGAIALHSPLLWILPIAGIVLGLVMAAWAPFGAAPDPASAGGSDVTAATASKPATTDANTDHTHSNDETGKADGSDESGSDATPE